MSFRLTYATDGDGCRDIELHFSDGVTSRFRPGGGLINSAVEVDLAGDGRRLLAVGFNASAPGEYAGALAAFDPLECRIQGANPRPVFLTRICEEPPAAFQESRGPCHARVLWAGDLDGKPGEELIVAWLHHRGPAQLIVFGRDWTRLGEYWHFGWPNQAFYWPGPSPASLEVDGRSCIAFLMVANEWPEGTRRRLAGELYHSAILILDSSTLLQPPDPDQHRHAFWSINQWMNRSSRQPPVAYGHVTRGEPAYGHREWQVVELQRFADQEAAILLLTLRNDLHIELDAHLNGLDVRVADPELFAPADLEVDAIWKRTWPPPP